MMKMNWIDTFLHRHFPGDDELHTFYRQSLVWMVVGGFLVGFIVSLIFNIALP